MKINNLRGDLTDISAEKEALVYTRLCLCGGPSGQRNSCFYRGTSAYIFEIPYSALPSVNLFSNQMQHFWAHFDPINIVNTRENI